jgi:hypothetical protein
MRRYSNGNEIVGLLWEYQMSKRTVVRTSTYLVPQPGNRPPKEVVEEEVIENTCGGVCKVVRAGVAIGIGLFVLGALTDAFDNTRR